MKGFEVWVAGPWSTLALVWGALAVGTVLGWGLATRPRGLSRGERRELADRAADRAARQFRRLGKDAKGADFMTDFIPPRRTSTAAFLDPTPYGAVMFAAVAPELAHEWEPKRSPSTEAARAAWDSNVAWSEHVDQALDVANGDPISTGEIRAIREDMDVFLKGLLAAHPVPYPDGDQ